MKKFLMGFFVLVLVILAGAVGAGYYFIYKPLIEIPAETTRLQKIMAPKNAFLIHSMNLHQYRAIDTYFLENPNPDYKYAPDFNVLEILKRGDLNLKQQANAMMVTVLIPEGEIKEPPKVAIGLAGVFQPTHFIQELKKNAFVTEKEHNGSKYFEYTFIKKEDCEKIGPHALYITNNTLINATPNSIGIWIDRVNKGTSVESADLTLFNEYQKFNLVTTQLIGLNPMLNKLKNSPRTKGFVKSEEIFQLETIIGTVGFDIEKKGVALNLNVLAKDDIKKWLAKTNQLKQKTKANAKDFSSNFPGFYGVLSAFYSELKGNKLKAGVVINEKMLEDLKLLPEEFLFFAFAGFDPEKAAKNPQLAEDAKKIVEELLEGDDQFKFTPTIKIEHFGKAEKLQWDNIPVYQYNKDNLALLVHGVEKIKDEDGADQIVLKLNFKMKNNINYPHMEDFAKLYIGDVQAENQDSLATDYHCGLRSMENPSKWTFSDIGEKEVLLRVNTPESQAKTIKGHIDFKVPHQLDQVTVTKQDIGKDIPIGADALFTLKKMNGGDITYTLKNTKTTIFHVSGLNKDQKQLKENRLGWREIPSKDPKKIDTHKVKFKGQVEFVEVTFVKSFKEYKENFEIPAQMAMLKEITEKDESSIQPYSYETYKKDYSEQVKKVSYVEVPSKKRRGRKRRKPRKKKVVEMVNKWKQVQVAKFPKKDPRVDIEGVEIYLNEMGSFHLAPTFTLRTHAIPELKGNANAIGIEVKEFTLQDGTVIGALTEEELAQKDNFGRPLIRGSFGRPVSLKQGGELKQDFWNKESFEAKVKLESGRQNIKPDQVKKLKGELYFNFPREIEKLVLENFDLGSRAGDDFFNLSIFKKEQGKLYFEVNGDFTKVLGAKFFNKNGELLRYDFGIETIGKKDPKTYYVYTPQGMPTKAEFTYGVDFEVKTFPFEFPPAE